ncbi:MAG TPA: hypothetical protein VH520_10940 [Streptosporangiaceae bacterium]
MPRAKQVPAAAVPRATTKSGTRIGQHAVILAAVALIVAQLGWKAYLLSQFYFRQDDFWLLDGALSHGLSPGYLFTIIGGHLRPGGLAIFWLVTRLSPYDWPLVSIVTVAGLAAASIMLLRLLVQLFGERPAILIPLIIFLFTPLTLSGLSFWTTTTDWLPLQLTVVAALCSHVRYVRSGRPGHAIAAAAWLAAGMLFDEQGVLVPFLLFALTSAYLVPGRWPTAARRALGSFRRAWAIYGVLTAGYLVLFLVKLQTSTQQPANPGHVASVLSLAATMLRVGFVPAAAGGPWRWIAPGGDFGFAAETAGLTQITWVLAALVAGVSLWYRRRALRAWLILAGWLLLADFGPVAISRLTELPATLLGEDMHYLADSAPILALVVGLAFWPVIGEQDPYRRARPRPVSLVVMACALAGVFLTGSIWSGAAYLSDASSARTRSYIATAEAALARAKPGTVIVSASTPWYVMYAGFLGPVSQTSRVLGPLAPERAGIRFVTAPRGAVTNLMMFDSRGRLRPALDVGATSVRPAGVEAACWPVQSAPTTIPLTARVFRYHWIIRLSYSGPATTMRLQLGSAVSDVVLPAGQRDLYVPVTGGGNEVVVRRLSRGPAACISRLTVGLMYTTRPPPIRAP